MVFRQIISVFVRRSEFLTPNAVSTKLAETIYPWDFDFDGPHQPELTRLLKQ